jgi:hypothetical protein
MGSSGEGAIGVMGGRAASYPVPPDGTRTGRTRRLSSNGRSPMLETGDYRRAALYIVLSVGMSIAAVLAGFALAQSLVGSPPSGD